MTAKETQKRYEGRTGAIVLGIVALVLAYGLGSRAFDTGSWWEYLGTFVLIIAGFNRLIVAVKNE